MRLYENLTEHLFVCLMSFLYIKESLREFPISIMRRKYSISLKFILVCGEIQPRPYYQRKFVMMCRKELFIWSTWSPAVIVKNNTGETKAQRTEDESLTYYAL